MEEKIFNYPGLNEKNIQNVGGIIIESGTLMVGEGIIFEEDTFDDKNFIMNPLDIVGYPELEITQMKTFLITKSDDRKCYGPITGMLSQTLYMLIPTPSLETDAFHVCVNSDNTLNVYLGNVRYTSVGKYKGRFKIEPNMIKDGDRSFAQKFIYDGIDEDYVKFIYREFTESMTQSSFQQSVKYRLKDEKIISFRDLKIQIHEANENNISYTVLRNFSNKELNN